MAVEQTRSGARPWQGLSLVLAVVVAVLAVLLLRQGDTAEAEVEEPEVEDVQDAGQTGAAPGDGLTATAESSAVLACAVMAEVDPAGFPDPSTDEAYVELQRLGAAQMLAFTAEAQDPDYAELRTLIEAPRIVQARTFLMDGPEYAEAVEQAQAECADRFPGEG